MASIFDEYEVVVGLECHVQLLTASKLFSPSPSRYGDAPNENVDVVDVALPGVLPVINARAVECAVKLGLALGCQIRRRSVFARKHYFYPDLPKGYQISQYDLPICEGGTVEIELGSVAKGLTSKKIQMTRIHIEEDAGKSIHADGTPYSFLDYNRAGTPLLEVVSEPDMRSSEEAMAYFRALRQIVVSLGICDGNLQEGSMRADANVSVRKKGETKFGQRVEIKNINSIRYLGWAIDYEMRRQILEINAGRNIVQETRLFDHEKRETRSLRSKEDAHDYRYFPDPDLPPLVLTDDEVEAIQKSLPELPKAKAARWQQDLGLSAYDARLLADDSALASYFEQALHAHTPDGAINPTSAKQIANWISNDVMRMINQLQTQAQKALLAAQEAAQDDDQDSEQNDGQNDGQNKEADKEAALDLAADLAALGIQPTSIASLVRLVEDGTISNKIAKDVMQVMFDEKGGDPASIVQARGWKVQRDAGALTEKIAALVAAHPAEVAQYRAGKGKVLGFFVGQMMKQTQGQADPQLLQQLVKQALDG